MFDQIFYFFMWPFTISDNACANKLRLGLVTKFDHAQLYGLTALDVVNDDYLLGYMTSEQLVKIEYYCRRRKPGPMLGIIARLYIPILGKERAIEAMETIEEGLRTGSPSSELGLGFRIGNMVNRVAFGEKTFDYDEDVKEAKRQAPILKGRADLAKESLDTLAFLILDRMFFDKHITDNFVTPEINKLKEVR